MNKKQATIKALELLAVDGSAMLETAMADDPDQYDLANEADLAKVEKELNVIIRSLLMRAKRLQASDRVTDAGLNVVNEGR